MTARTSARARACAVLAVALAVVASACTPTLAPTAGPPATRPATTPAPAVSATPTPTPTTTGWTLPDGTTMSAVFGDPWTRDEPRRHAVVRSALRLIEETPAGETLMVSVFNMTYPGFGDALVEAHDRGVRVRVLVNAEHVKGERYRVLRRELGDDRRAKSWFVVRDGGIRMHSKFVLASRSGGADHVVWMSSGNMTLASGRQQANEALTITGDKELYDFFAEQLGLMAKGVTDPRRLARTATTPTARVQTFPLPEGGRENDPVAALLDDITCVTPGGRTVVRLAQLFLTDERIWLAERLRELKAAGCDVRVVGYLHVWVDAPDLLVQPGPGQIDLRASARRALHTKITTIDGFDGDGRPLKVLMSGSHNLTGRALTRTSKGVNDEFSIQVWDPATVDTYSAWVDGVLSDHSIPYAG